MSTRETIITTARRLFYERGFVHTSLADLADAAGVPKGNFYYHFKTRDDVLEAVLSARRADIEGALDRWRSEIPKPGHRVRRVVRMLTRDRDDLVRFGCPIGSMLTELGKDHPEMKASVIEQLDLFTGFITAELVRIGHKKGTARTLALRILARCQGVVLLAHAYGSPELLAREVRDIDQWLDDLLDV